MVSHIAIVMALPVDIADGTTSCPIVIIPLKYASRYLQVDIVTFYLVISLHHDRGIILDNGVDR